MTCFLRWYTTTLVKAFDGIIDKKDVSHLLDFLEDWIRIGWEYGENTRLAFVDYYDTDPKNHPIGKLDTILDEYAAKNKKP